MSTILGVHVSDMPLEVRQVVEHYAAESGVSMDLLLSRTKTDQLVTTRRAIAKRLRKLGYSLPIIGQALNRHHTSVLHLVRTP